MQARPFALAAASVGALAAFVAGSTSTQRYRVNTTNEATLDLTALGGQTQHQNSKLTTFYTVALSDSASGQTVHATLDSVAVDADSTSMPPPAPMRDSARGATVTAFLGAGGVVSDLKIGTQNFYPRMKPTARVGDKWTDTVEYDTPQGTAGKVHTKAIANWVVTAEEQHDGIKARKVQSAYSWARNGTIEGPQGSVTLDGTATGAATYWVAADGRMLGANLGEDAAMTITVAQAPAPIPVKSKNTVIISAIK